MAENDILGISAHLDFNDIQKSFDQLINGLDKIGIKTDVLSKRMNDAMNEIARSTDDTATKNKKAMDVFTQGISEAKLALEKYPEALRQAKNEEEATALATARLEEQLKKLNTQFLSSNVGSAEYDRLKQSIAGVEQQIQSNNRAHEAQLATIQEMESGYNSLVSLYGVANTATAANAVAHSATAVTVGAEAAQHAVNTEKIGEETRAALENKNAKEQQVDIEQRVAQAIEMETSSYDGLLEKIHSGKVSSEEYARVIEGLRERIAALRNESLNVGEKFDTEQGKALTWDNGGETPLGDENKVRALREEYSILSNQIGALEGILSEVESAWNGLHGTAEKAQAEMTNETRRTTEAVREYNAESEKEPSGFRQQWQNVNEMHDKIRELTRELREHEAEYDKLADKPGFDEQSKKARELQEHISNLKKEIADTKKEMSEETGAGSVLARWTNSVKDALTGNGRFQDSLGNMKTALGGLVAPFSAATTGAMTFVKSLWAMASTPIGAVISAIVLGLQALFAWFNKDAEGQRAFAKITAYVGSLLSSITDIAVRIGKYLFHAFADPQGALNQFGRGLVGLVVNPLKAVGNTLAGVGQIAKGVLDLIRSGANVAEAKKAVGSISEGWESLKKAAGNVADTVRSVWDAGAGAVSGAVDLIGKGLKTTWETNLTESGTKMFEVARQSAKLAGQELEVQKAISEAKRDEAKLDIEIAKEREKIYTLTGKEKDAQIEKVKQMLKEKYQPQIQAQQKLLEIQQKRNNLHTVSLEQLSKEREAQGAVYALQARAAASTRMLVRMQQANLKSMANASKKDAQIKEAETNYDEVVRKNALAQAKAETEIQQKLADARIAAMKDGAEKVLAEKNRSFEKELQQIDEQRKAAIEAERARQKAEFDAQEKVIKARGGKTKQWSEAEVDKTAISAINEQYEQLKRYAVTRQQNDEIQKEVQSMIEYLKEYGSIQEQKAAISQEYDLKIAKASDEIQKESLRQQKSRLINELDMKEMRSSLDWDVIFNDLNKQSVSALQTLKQKLKVALDAKDITAENAKILAEKIREIEDEITRKTDAWASWLPGLRERKRLSLQILEIEEEINGLQTVRDTKSLKQGSAVADFASIIGQGKESFKSQWGEIDRETIARMKTFYDIANQSEQVRNAFALLETSTIDLTKSQEDLKKAQEIRKQRQNAFDNFTKGGSVSQYFKDITAGFNPADYASLINQNAQSMATFVDKIGIGETEFGKSVHDFADGVGGFNNAIQSLMSGDIFGAINGVIDGFVGLGNAFGRPFGLGGADYTSYNNLVKQYDSLIKVWDEIISRKEKYLSLSYGTEVTKTQQEIEALYKKEDEAYRELGKKRLNSGASTGSSSIGKRMVKNMSDKDWNDIANALGWNIAKTKDFIGEVRMTGLFDLSVEQLKKLQEEAPAFWASMDEDVRKYLEGIIASNEALEESYDKAKERALSSSFDDVFNSFMSNMYNMADGAKDVEKQMADDWRQMMNKMVLNNLMGEKYKEKLKAWYEKWYAAYNGDNNITKQEISDLRNEYNALTKEAADEVKALREQGLIKQTNSNDQQSTYNSLEKWSYEQADDLINRATALQIIDENQYQILSQSLEVAYSTLSGVEGIRTTVQEIASAIAVTIELQESANGKLDKIIANTNPIGEIRDLVKKLYNER